MELTLRSRIAINRDRFNYVCSTETEKWALRKDANYKLLSHTVELLLP